MSPPAPDEFIVVLVTVPSADAGAEMGRSLVQERLAGCVNIIPGLRSLYMYEGELCDDPEALCVIKTGRANYAALRERIEALHPYDVPEIIAVPITEGNPDYLAWLSETPFAPI